MTGSYACWGRMRQSGELPAAKVLKVPLRDVAVRTVHERARPSTGSSFDWAVSA